MVDARLGSRARWVVGVTFCLSALSGSKSGWAKPRAETKDEAATRLEKKAIQSYVAHDAASAGRMLEHALRTCEPKGCSPKTTSRLHVSFGTVKGAGDGDYATAKKEFTSALQLDPEAQLNPALANAELRAAFAEARGAALPPEKPATGTKPPEKAPETPPEKPALSVSELLHPEDNAPPPPVVKKPPRDAAPGLEPRSNWLSVRAMIDFAYVADANICSPGAPPSYFCTGEDGRRYTGRPQPNDDVSRGFALSTARLVLGYERVLFAGLTAGVFAGFALPLASSPEGRSGLLPLHFEARGSYTFGSSPYIDSAARVAPFVYLAGGAQQLDTHVVIRVSEIPCGSRVGVACKRDLDAYRRTSGVFVGLGGGVRLRLGGPHALRAAVRGSLVLDGTFVASPELTYELGF